MDIPAYAAEILDRLEKAGYEAYIVGGCVRDTIMGAVPHDYDVTTAALPDEVEKLFADKRVIETGIRHGTVTVLCGGEPVEITTFRIDGEYTDRRRPASVTFSKSIVEDLSRRDFTVNGMAYSPRRGLIDPFGGQTDIDNGVIRCIGAPDKRFGEDALRILRALRFASVLGFRIEDGTALSVVANRGLLAAVSRERVFSELKKILLGKEAEQVLKAYPEIICEVIPQLKAAVGYDQCSRYHNSTLYEHIARAVGAAERSVPLRLAMLLHDMAKPLCRTTDENGAGHYYGHAEVGARLADEVLRALKCDNATRERVCEIIRCHDAPLSVGEKNVRRYMARYGEYFHDIISAHIADDSAKQPFCMERLAVYREILATAEELSRRESCLTLKQLAVNGRDLSAIMPPSPQMGEVLRRLLDEVIEGGLPNEREALLHRAEELANEKQ